MKAITVAQPGAAPQVTSDIPTPSPGEGQVLVKTLYTAINPVDEITASTGALVDAWPHTPGCDSAGVITQLGPNPISALGHEFKVGDKVFGCTRVGQKGYTAWSESHLFDASICIPLPSTLPLPAAASIGTALLTAAIGIFEHLAIPFPDPANLPAAGARDEWALVFGGAGSVGQASVQLLKVAGFKVIATGGAGSAELLKNIGASATVDYKQSTDAIVEEVKRVTNGNLAYAFDAVGKNNDVLTAVYTALQDTTPGPRHYVTTDDWAPLPVLANTTAGGIQLGPIGQPSATKLNVFLQKVIPVLFKLLEQETIKPSAYSVEGAGIEGVLKAWEVQKSGVKGSTKVVVKIADE
ncbi:chaperonin 10-like protein [Paraphoma chrysanthemicola]|uniref:Chaperonin 10-like protein n=1 Tax=Paraphoma chrysanthemicola TaxID=798071 RepID=A0A8K0R3Y1_9PLEO|nr:chaperonin 10-like protein [Paraphoma chrysanthemicola]